MVNYISPMKAFAKPWPLNQHIQNILVKTICKIMTIKNNISSYSHQDYHKNKGHYNIFVLAHGHNGIP